MGILELHFHDSELSWTMSPGTDSERSFSLESESESVTDDGQRERPSVKPKLRSLAIVALVVGAGIAYNRMKARRREAAEESSSRLPRIRSR